MIVKFIKIELICRYGIPSKLITDNPINLNNKMMIKLCDDFKGQSRSLMCDIVYLKNVIFAIIWFQVHCTYLSLCYVMIASVNTFSLFGIKFPFFLSLFVHRAFNNDILKGNSTLNLKALYLL